MVIAQDGALRVQTRDEAFDTAYVGDGNGGDGLGGATASGLEPECNVLAQMAFGPAICTDLREMDAAIFTGPPLGLPDLRRLGSAGRRSGTPGRDRSQELSDAHRGHHQPPEPGRMIQPQAQRALERGLDRHVVGVLEV